jgi:hypothetical protein
MTSKRRIFGRMRSIPTAAAPGSPPVRLAVAWYREADWPRLRAISVDRDKLEDTHADWLRMAEQNLAELAKAGLLAEPIEVTVEELEAWCQHRRREVDGSARAEFATELLRRKYSK